MSIEAVKDFYEKVATDKDFLKKLDELQNKVTEGLELPLAQDKKEELTKDVIIPFAKEQGFYFSIEDIKEFEKSIIEELDEEQLKDIAAGHLGGLSGAGSGATICKVIGVGFVLWADRGCGGFCILLGFGWGRGGCTVIGGGDGY